MHAGRGRQAEKGWHGRVQFPSTTAPAPVTPEETLFSEPSGGGGLMAFCFSSWATPPAMTAAGEPGGEIKSGGDAESLGRWCSSGLDSRCGRPAPPAASPTMAQMSREQDRHSTPRVGRSACSPSADIILRSLPSSLLHLPATTCNSQPALRTVNQRLGCGWVEDAVRQHERLDDGIVQDELAPSHKQPRAPGEDLHAVGVPHLPADRDVALQAFGDRDA